MYIEQAEQLCVSKFLQTFFIHECCAFQPLLNNLKRDADKKDYIQWKDRGPKIEAFEAHLAKIYYGS